MAKYDALTSALQAQDGTVAEMTLDDVAGIVGGLPESAYVHRAWWANSTAGNNAHSRGWLSAGWRVDRVDLNTRMVRFARLPEEAAVPSAPQTSSPRQIVELLPTGDALKVQITAEWHPAGEVTIDAAGKPVFPQLPGDAGIYRLTLTVDGVPSEAYLGESDNLRRRTAGNYRSPGVTQQTSTRINEWLRRHLAEGAAVRVDVITHADAVLGYEPVELDLSAKAARLLVESAAVVDTANAGMLTLINR